MARVLVIDDDKDIATTTSMHLEAGKHQVEIELNENNAVTHIEKMNPLFIVRNMTNETHSISSRHVSSTKLTFLPNTRNLHSFYFV